MRKILLALALVICGSTWAEAQRSRVFGYCEDGNQVVVTSSINSTTLVQRSYPGCTIDVFEPGTTTSASIFSDAGGTPLANPFTASATGYWFFYADNGCYDVQLSDGGIAAPYTWGDVCVFSSEGDVTFLGDVTFEGDVTFNGDVFLSETTEIHWPNAFLLQGSEPHGDTFGLTDGLTSTFNGTIRHRPIQPSSVTLFVGAASVGTDDGAGNITGATIFSGSIDYTTGVISVTFNSPPAAGEFVRITDIVDDNLILGTDSGTPQNAFVVIQNDVKINGPAPGRGLGALFTQLEFVSLVSAAGTPPVNPFFGAVQFYQKNDAIGSVALYYRDYGLNEYTICALELANCAGLSGGYVQIEDEGTPLTQRSTVNFTGAGISCLDDAGNLETDCDIPGGTSFNTINCGDCPPGGIVGGLFNSASTTTSPFGFAAALGSDKWSFPESGYLGGLGFCAQAALAATGGVAFANWILHNAGGTLFDVQTFFATYSGPDTPLPCQQTALDLLPVERGVPVQARVASVTAGSMAGWSAQWLGSTAQPLGSVFNNAVVGTGATVFTSFGQSDQLSATESDVAMPIPYAGTVSDLCVSLRVGQPATGSLVFTVRDSGVDTSVVTTIPSSGSAGGSVRHCSTGTHVFSAGDYLTVSILNNASANSGNMATMSFIFTPTTAGRAMLVFPVALVTFTTSTTQYTPPFVRINLSTTEATWRGPLPVPGTMQNFYCYVDVAPAADLVVTAMRNGSSSTVTHTITSAGGTGVQQGTGTQAFVATDSLTLEWANGAGSVAQVGGCTAEYVYP